MLVKIHESYRKIVAVCDAELLGRRFEEGKMQIDVSEAFYNGEKKTDKEVIELLKDAATEDATFNILGEKSISAAIRAGIIDEKGIIKIQGIPHALSLL
jgi:hypothetical protein